jgi:hypothetical protein
MNHFSAYIVCMIIGIAVGWDIGYTWPIAKDQREILKQFRHAQKAMQLADAEIIQHGAKAPEYYALMRRSDELAATLSLEAFEHIERGDTEKARQFLVSKIGHYYAVHRTNDGYTNLITRIEKAALKCPAVAAEISKKPE